VLVGTSYSASVTTQLLKKDHFDLVVETAPMMRFDETDPQTVAILNFWKNWLRMNPFAGEALARQYLLNSFSSYWIPRVDDLLKTYPQYRKPGLKEKMVMGYSHMSLLAEGFDFSEQDLTAARRFFIFGENEEEGRLKLQLKVAKQYQQLTGDKNSSVVVKGSGHVVPNDAPEQYLKLLKDLL
jgi:pimeloyl-ACP methyl ester carboxylesterase